MKCICLSGLFLLFLFTMFTACGGPDSASSSNTNNQAHSTPARTSVVILEQTVRVTLVEYKITSPLTTFHVGQPYHFVVTNKGTIPHEFMVMPPMGDSVPMSSMIGASLVYLDFINPGQTRTIDYTFTRPNAHLEFACHFTGRQANDSHYDMGMRLPIIVE